MSKIQWKGSALLAPVPPVLVTTGTPEDPNVCTVAWCGMLSTNPPKTYIALRPSRLSYTKAIERGEFVINLPTGVLVRAIDRCGVKSGRDENKFETCKLTPGKASVVSAPTIEESPLSVECRIEQVISLGSHDMLLASIVAVDVEESLIDTKGKLRLAKAGLACYAHGEYFALGKKIGDFGFSVRKKKKRQKPHSHKTNKIHSSESTNGNNSNSGSSYSNNSSGNGSSKSKTRKYDSPIHNKDRSEAPRK